ncbi:MAG TPA: phage holin family protein [Kofleriaceae bacterium]|jgi:hypothetical protein
MERHHDPAGSSSSELIGGVLDDARELASAELDKLKAEAKQVGESAKITGIALAFLITAAVLVGTGVALGLGALGLPAWASFLVVGSAFGIVGTLVIKYPRAIANAF